MFILHRDNSTASTHTRRRSVLSVRRRSPTAEGSYRLMGPGEEENEAPAPPLVVVYSPTVSRRGSFSREESPSKRMSEIDITDVGPEGSGSGFDASPIPLRVVYSPAVSRNPSIGRSSHSQKASLASNIRIDPNDPDLEQMLPPSNVSPTSASFEPAIPSESQISRRRPSTASTTESRGLAVEGPFPSPRPPSYESSPTDRASRLEEGNRDDISPPHFVAFPERKWLRAVVVAKIALAVVTICVLVNLVYT